MEEPRTRQLGGPHRRGARRLLPLGTIPLVVVTATEGNETVKQQSAWLRVSSRSRQTTLEGGHELHKENPDGVVTEIESTLDRSDARSGSYVGFGVEPAAGADTRGVRRPRRGSQTHPLRAGHHHRSSGERCHSVATGA